MCVLSLLFHRSRSVHRTCAGAEKSQAPNLFDVLDKRGKYGLVHNIGLGGAAFVSLLRRPEFFEAGGEDGRTRYGFPCVMLSKLSRVLIRDRTSASGSGTTMHRNASQSRRWS